MKNLKGVKRCAKLIILNAAALLSTFPQDRYAVIDGTSMARPAAVGIAAMLLSCRPDILSLPRNQQRTDEMLKFLCFYPCIFNLWVLTLPLKVKECFFYDVERFRIMIVLLKQKTGDDIMQASGVENMLRNNKARLIDGSMLPELAKVEIEEQNIVRRSLI